MDVPSAASAAATSSWVDSGLQPDHEISAPAARSVRMRTAVSFVTWRQPAMRWPLSGLDSLYFSRSAMRTGMRDSAHSMRRRPLSASLRSATLKFDIYRLLSAYSDGLMGAIRLKRQLQL